MRRPNDPIALFITGAGLSADSGVPTFRGPGGLYEGVSVTEVLSDRGMRESPERVHRFHDDFRVALASFEPNPSHRALADLTLRYPGRIAVTTQNIDDLLERAGCPDTIHLHGSVMRMRSIGNSRMIEEMGYVRYWDGDPSLAPPRGFRFRCPRTGSLYRPDVVLFNEIAPEYARLYRWMKGLRRDDLLVVIGSQGSVLPLTQLARNAPCRALLNNLHPSDHIDEEAFDVVIREPAAEAAGRIAEIVMSMLGDCSTGQRIPATTAQRSSSNPT